MLLVSRRIGQRIVINGNVEITIVSTGRKGARLAVAAPKGVTVIRGEVFDDVRNANHTMRLNGTRFGDLEIKSEHEVELQILGFPDNKRYALLEGNEPSTGWLQSLDDPALAFPVIDGAAVRTNAPMPTKGELANAAGLQPNGEVAVFFVIAPAEDESARRQLVANTLAPIVIDVTARRGTQTVLDGDQYSAMEPLFVTGAAAEAAR